MLLCDFESLASRTCPFEWTLNYYRFCNLIGSFFHLQLFFIQLLTSKPATNVMFVKLSVQSVIIRGCGNKTPPTVCLYVIIPILWWNISAVLLPRTRLPVHSFCTPPPCLSRTGYFQVDFLVLKSVSIDKSNPRCKQKCFARRLRFIFSSVAEEFLTLRNLNLAYCRKIIHKWHKINTKYNKPFMIKEIIDEVLGR